MSQNWKQNYLHVLIKVMYLLAFIMSNGGTRGDQVGSQQSNALCAWVSPGRTVSY